MKKTRMLKTYRLTNFPWFLQHQCVSQSIGSCKHNHVNHQDVWFCTLPLDGIALSVPLFPVDVLSLLCFFLMVSVLPSPLGQSSGS